MSLPVKIIEVELTPSTPHMYDPSSEGRLSWLSIVSVWPQMSSPFLYHETRPWRHRSESVIPLLLHSRAGVTSTLEGLLVQAWVCCRAHRAITQITLNMLIRFTIELGSMEIQLATKLFYSYFIYWVNH